MRSHVVRIGHRQASEGTVAQAAPARILDRAPRTVREQYLDRKHAEADASIVAYVKAVADFHERVPRATPRFTLSALDFTA